MNTESEKRPNPPDIPQTGREAAWAKPVDRVRVTSVPQEALNLNVEGRQLTNPLQGFGQMWQKTYRIQLQGPRRITPEEVIATWRENFGSFWPGRNRFYTPLTRIEPGEVAVLNLEAPGNLKLSTGILVIYADERSFTFMTPEGHMFAGWITFSADDDNGQTSAQAQVLLRANDPLWEVAMRLFGYQKEDQFWAQTLRNLAARFECEGQVTQETRCIDPQVQWSQAKNIWHNAGIRSGVYAMTAPLRWVSRRLK